MTLVPESRSVKYQVEQRLIEELAGRFAGDLIQPGDVSYDQSRAIWNGMIDKRPAVIARCAGVSDVILAVNFARENDLYPAVRGGGHNVAGHAMSDGGVTIDLSLMRSVHIDPARRIARVEGGATWADFEREASVFGLSTTGGVISSTGVAGLTLGGGIGWLVGRHGLSVDNLLAVELVTASGEWIRCTQTEHPDLFWALRGGGGNFGVVTLFEFQLHPVENVLAGFFAWPAEEGRDVARFYAEFTKSNPEDMTTYLEYAPDPESGARMTMIAFFFPEDTDEARGIINSIREFKQPVAEVVEVMPYRDWQMAFDAEFPHGNRYYWKGVLFQEFSRETADVVHEYSSVPEGHGTIVAVEHYRGAMNRIPVEATAFPHRKAQYQVVIAGGWTDAGDDNRARSWVRRFANALAPRSMDARFLNFNDIDAAEKSEVVRASYGTNFERLVQVKQQYDPGNRFSQNNNISPKGS